MSIILFTKDLKLTLGCSSEEPKESPAFDPFAKIVPRFKFGEERNVFDDEFRKALHSSPKSLFPLDPDSPPFHPSSNSPPINKGFKFDLSKVNQKPFGSWADKAFSNNNNRDMFQNPFTTDNLGNRVRFPISDDFTQALTRQIQF